MTIAITPLQIAAAEAHLARRARMSSPRQLPPPKREIAAPEVAELVKCPCCNSRVPAIGIDALRYLQLPALVMRTLEVLIDTYPRAKSRRQLASLVYDDRPNGGPDTAENAVSVYMSRMRPKLHAVGWTVGWDTAAHGIRLSRLKKKAASA